MRSYTAHLRDGRAPVLIREGWSWGAALFGPLWLLVERSWIPLLLEAASLGLAEALLPDRFWAAALAGLFLFNGLLGRDLARWSLERRGYALGSVVLATDRDAALLRLFAARPELLERLS